METRAHTHTSGSRLAGSPSGARALDLKSPPPAVPLVLEADQTEQYFLKPVRKRLDPPVPYLQRSCVFAGVFVLF